MRKIIWCLIFISIAVRLIIFLVLHNNYFLRPFDPVYFGKLYSESQYVLGDLSKGGIGDDGLYAYAGYHYVFNRGNVADINFEHPPLGKYLIGLSILIFRNENVINIIYFTLILLVTYKIAIFLFHDDLLAIISAAILSFDPLINDHLIRSLLDLPFTLFFLTALYMFLKALKKTNYLYLSFFFWGAAFATKFFPFFIIIYLYLLVTFYLFQKKKIFSFIKASLIVPVFYLVIHISFFIYHPSLLEFIRHKKWMVAWWRGSPIIPGNLLRNIFTGQYIDSTGRLTRDHLWSLLQPVIFFFSVTSLRKSFFGKEKTAGIVYIFCLIYIVYMLFLTNGIFKYIMPVYPLLIIFAVKAVSNYYLIFFHGKIRHKGSYS